MEFLVQIVRDIDRAEKEPNRVVISALGGKAKYHEFDASLGYTAKFCLFLKLMKCVQTNINVKVCIYYDRKLGSEQKEGRVEGFR